jgi:gamma-glutamyltranspeptidase
MALGILEVAQEEGIIRPLLEMEHNSAEYLHAIIEALRYECHTSKTMTKFVSELHLLVPLNGFDLKHLLIEHYSDSMHWVTDPDMMPVPAQKLLSKV